jgi:hypothetical protein
MEFELIGRDGKTHDAFSSREEAIDVLRKEERAFPGLTAGWMIQAYDEDGEEVGEPVNADDLVVRTFVSEAAEVCFVGSPSTGGVFMSVAKAVPRGKAQSSRRGSDRRRSAATDTPAQPVGEPVAG